MLKGLRALHLARPGLDSIDIRGVAVEHVCPDGGDESKKEGGEECRQRKKSTECVFLTKGQLKFVSLHDHCARSPEVKLT